MMIQLFCVFIILAVAYAMHHEGLFTAVTMLVNVLLAGFLTFEFGNRLPTCSMVFSAAAPWQASKIAWPWSFFSLSLGILRLATNSLAFNEVEFEPNLNRFGSIVVGGYTGYFVTGLLVVCFQTLPWNERFLGFSPAQGRRGWLP